MHRVSVTLGRFTSLPASHICSPGSSHMVLVHMACPDRLKQATIALVVSMDQRLLVGEDLGMDLALAIQGPIEGQYASVINPVHPLPRNYVLNTQVHI